MPIITVNDHPKTQWTNRKCHLKHELAPGASRIALPMFPTTDTTCSVCVSIGNVAAEGHDPPPIFANEKIDLTLKSPPNAQ